MIIYPNAKINIGLNITEKRNDGFHNIESIFYPLYKLTDKIEIKENKIFSITNSGINLNIKPENNLIYKSFKYLKDNFKIPNVSINLEKNIPFGAGLGGGSADASFVLKSLNKIFNLNLNDIKLKDIAIEICSDCPFFIENKPKFVYNKGDYFNEIKLDLSGYYIVLIKPDIFISTKEAYSYIKPKFRNFELNNIINEPINKWKDNIVNDFEDSIFKKYPLLNNIKQNLYNNGALYSSMSGSGSTIYGIFEKEISIKNIDNFFVWNNFM